MTRKEVCDRLDAVWAQVELAHTKLAELIPEVENETSKGQLTELSLELKQKANEIAELGDNIDKERES